MRLAVDRGDHVGDARRGARPWVTTDRKKPKKITGTSIAASSGVRMTISSFDEPASSMVVAGIAMQVVAEVLEGLLSAVGRVLGRDLSELRRMSIRPDGATRYEPERCRTRTIGIRSGCLAPALVVADRAGDTRSARGDSEGGASDENRLALEGHELLRLCREFER